PLNGSNEWQTTFSDRGIHYATLTSSDGTLETTYLFAIKLSPYCGDGTCDNSTQGSLAETCSTCETDCGECAETSGDSGSTGGGVSRTIQYIIQEPEEIYSGDAEKIEELLNQLNLEGKTEYMLFFEKVPLYFFNVTEGTVISFGYKGDIYHLEMIRVGEESDVALYKGKLTDQDLITGATVIEDESYKKITSKLLKGVQNLFDINYDSKNDLVLTLREVAGDNAYLVMAFISEEAPAIGEKAAYVGEVKSLMHLNYILLAIIALIVTVFVAYRLNKDKVNPRKRKR
ncbi:hypothetical protein GOV06_00560, partial [Candidatus Woesearchaeota archaeon]|nr:hypothetical protein [Candidatus Woesearchaeota archaeon]